ncbi:hypothetical protein ABPG75_002790 [Micractinium tetrahymenae]
MACSALYRHSKLGLSLVDALDQLVEEGKLPPQLALRILDEYDSVVLDALETKVTAKASLKGHLDSYKNYYYVSCCCGQASRQPAGELWRQSGLIDHTAKMSSHALLLFTLGCRAARGGTRQR